MYNFIRRGCLSSIDLVLPDFLWRLCTNILQSCFDGIWLYSWLSIFSSRHDLSTRASLAPPSRFGARCAKISLRYSDPVFQNQLYSRSVQLYNWSFLLLSRLVNNLSAVLIVQNPLAVLVILSACCGFNHSKSFGGCNRSKSFGGLIILR